jgi:hypothetical protein
MNNKKVSQKDYIEFSKNFAKNFSKPQGIRFGQAFCNEFMITDPKLFYEVEPVTAINYIWENYIEEK